jgi:hypothetical protein
MLEKKSKAKLVLQDNKGISTFIFYSWQEKRTVVKGRVWDEL